MTGLGHLEFNSGILNYLSSIKNVHFYGEKSLVKNIQLKMIDNAYIKTSSFFFPEANSKIKLLLREILGIIYLTLLFLYNYRERKKSTLIFLSIIPLTHLYCKFLNVLFKYEIKIFLHGEMEALNPKNKMISVKYYYRFSCIALKMQNYRFSYFVLGESIMSNIKKIAGVRNIDFIDHPYSLVNNEFENLKTSNKTEYTFGTVGRAIAGEKNSQLIFQLANEVQSTKNLISANFEIAGSISKEILEYANEKVSYHLSSTMLGQEEFIKKVLKLDFILFFYSKDAYQFSASGAFFDCVKFETPIIAIKNNFFLYYFEKYGDIGLLAENYDELKFAIIDLLNIQSDELERKILSFKLNLRKMKKDLLTNNFSLDKIVFN
jgi:hypothetical protein